MAGSWQRLALAVLLTATVCGSATAQACGSTLAWAVVYYPACDGSWQAGALLVSVASPYAKPTAAPPSSEAIVPKKVMPLAPEVAEPPPIEKPLVRPRVPVESSTEAKKGPMVVEARFQAGGIGSSRLCRVGFWNLSGHGVILKIDGRAHTVASDRAVTLDLPRRFTWQADDAPAHEEQVPEARSTHDVVIR